MAAGTDFSALETKIRERAERQIESLKTIQATYAEIETERAAFLAADAERLKKLDAAIADSAGVFTAKELAAWKLSALTESKRSAAGRRAAGRKKAPNENRPAPSTKDAELVANAG